MSNEIAHAVELASSESIANSIFKYLALFSIFPPKNADLPTSARAKLTEAML